MDMDIRHLEQAIVDQGIHFTNFFNGQLLSGKDLTREKAANRQARELLGKAAGYGIAYGLEVQHETTLADNGEPVVRVTAGLGINREGAAIQLEKDVLVRLDTGKSGTSGESGTSSEEVFIRCSDVELDDGTYVPGAGLYLMTVMPVEVKRGQAPVNGLRNSTATCGYETITEGVRFRSIKLELSDEDLGQGNCLRNHIAYRMFGTTDPGYTDFVADPFGLPAEGYGWLDTLRDGRLYDCEIPLALIYRTALDGLVFVDNWSVRRRLMTPPLTQAPLFAPERRLREGEAMFLQFQEQFQWLRRHSSVTAFTNLRLREYFRYVPAAGVVPLSTPRDEPSGTRPRGVNFRKFFKDVIYRHLLNDENIVIEGARVVPLLRAAREYPPVDLTTGEMLWIYSVRENLQAIEASPLNPPQQYVIFTSGHMPFMGDPHYDVNRFNFSNYL
jgi:hypothetical protein